MRETMSETEVTQLVNEIRNSIKAMRDSKLLTKHSILAYIGKNNVALRSHAEKLHSYGYELGDTKETRKLMIWNEYLGMELERITHIPNDMRKSRAITAKASGTSRIKNDNSAAIASFLQSKKG